MMFSKEIRRLGIYLVIFIVVTALSYILIKLYYYHYYTPGAAEKLLSSPSEYKFYSDNPCSTAISGDPVDAGLKYVKINIHCDKNQTTTNTLDLRAVKDPTYKGLIKLLGDINNFRTQISDTQIEYLGVLKKTEKDEWKCFADKLHETPIHDFNLALRDQLTLDCFYDFDESSINEYYAHH